MIADQYNIKKPEEYDDDVGQGLDNILVLNPKELDKKKLSQLRSKQKESGFTILQ